VRQKAEGRRQKKSATEARRKFIPSTVEGQRKTDSTQNTQKEMNDAEKIPET